MYPYFSSKKSIPKPVFAREAEKTHSLITENNSKLLQIIEDSIKDEMKDQLFYERLMDFLNDEDKEIANSMALDEIKHQKLLSHIYKLLGGSEPPKFEADEVVLKGSAPENISDAILDEAEAAKFYRELMLSSENGDIRDIFFEIMTDEANHAALGNYLFTKYSH